MMEPDICSNRHKANGYSFLANLRIAGRKHPLRERIYLYLRDHGPATCEELSLRLGIRYTTCSARLSELKAERWIALSGEDRETTGGTRAGVVRHVTAEEHEALINPQRPRYEWRQKELF